MNTTRKQYRLLKDMPYYEAGIIYEQVDNMVYKPKDILGGIEMGALFVENRSDWFEEVKPFEWTDELVMEFLSTYIRKASFQLQYTLDDFKRSKQQP